MKSRSKRFQLVNVIMSNNFTVSGRALQKAVQLFIAIPLCNVFRRFKSLI